MNYAIQMLSTRVARLGRLRLSRMAFSKKSGTSLPLSPLIDIGDRRNRDVLGLDLFRNWDPWDLSYPFSRGVLPQNSLAMDTDIIENPKELKIEIDLPGFNLSDIRIAINRGILTVKAERHRTEEVHKDFHQVVERHFGTVNKSIRIPSDVNMDSPEASYLNGVLTIKFKKDEETSREIPIAITSK